MFYILCLKYILNLWSHEVKFVKIIAGCVVSYNCSTLVRRTKFASVLDSPLKFMVTLITLRAS